MIQFASPNLATWNDRDLYKFFRDIRERFSWVSFTWNPPNIPAASTVDTTLTTSDGDFKGLRVGQAVFVSPPSSLDAGLVVGGAWVATDDTITIRLGNVTAGGINPVSATWGAEGWLTT